jgi:hypothetical protein
MSETSSESWRACDRCPHSPISQWSFCCGGFKMSPEVTTASSEFLSDISVLRKSPTASVLIDTPPLLTPGRVDCGVPCVSRGPGQRRVRPCPPAPAHGHEPAAVPLLDRLLPQHVCIKMAPACHVVGVMRLLATRCAASLWRSGVPLGAELVYLYADKHHLARSMSIPRGRKQLGAELVYHMRTIANGPYPAQ